MSLVIKRVFNVGYSSSSDDEREYRFKLEYEDAGGISRAETELAKLALDAGLTNTQASCVLRWSNRRIE